VSGTEQTVYLKQDVCSIHWKSRNKELQTVKKHVKITGKKRETQRLTYQTAVFLHDRLVHPETTSERFTLQGFMRDIGKTDIG